MIKVLINNELKEFHLPLIKINGNQSASPFGTWHYLPSVLTDGAMTAVCSISDIKKAWNQPI
jgi:hypothetical protein